MAQPQSFDTYRVSEDFWIQIAPLLPEYPVSPWGGRPRAKLRNIVDAIFYCLRTGCQWKAIPPQLVRGSTAHQYFQEWVQLGIFEELWAIALKVYDDLKGIDWQWQSADGAMTKAPWGEKIRQLLWATAIRLCILYFSTIWGFRIGSKVRLRVWNKTSGRIVLNLDWQANQIKQVSFSPNSEQICAQLATYDDQNSEESHLIVWNVQKGTLLFSTNKAASPKWSPDRNFLVGKKGDSIEIWSGMNFQHLYTVEGDDIEFSPNGAWLSSSKGLWNTATGKRVVDFRWTRVSRWSPSWDRVAYVIGKKEW